MGTSAKSRVKASSAHSTASPTASRRTRSTSRPRAGKDSRRAGSTSKDSSKHASTSSRREPSRYEESKRGKSTKKADSDYVDDAESVDSDAADRKKRSLLKKQKAQLRAQSPDEDLYQSSSASSASESSSESDGIHVVVQAKRKLVPVVSIPAKSRTSTTRTQNAPPVKSRADAEKAAPRQASQSRPSPAKKRRLDSDSVSPPPLRVLSSRQAKSPAKRPKARPSAPSSAKVLAEEPSRRREKVKASSPPLHSTYRSPKAQQEVSQGRPALHPPKRIKTMPSESDSERSNTPPAKIVAASIRKPADQHPIARPTAHIPASVKGRKRLPSPSDTDSDASDLNDSKPLSPPHAQIYIERTTVLRTAPQTSTFSLRERERSHYASRSPEVSKGSVEGNRRETRQHTLSSSPLPPPLAEREDSQSSDRYQASSLKARKSTLSATLKSLVNTLPAESNLGSPRAARQSASEAPRHSKPFQRITRSSSDEDTTDEAPSAKTDLRSPDKVATRPGRQRPGPREDDSEKLYQRAAEPLRKDASHEEQVDLFTDEEGGRSEMPVAQRLVQIEAEMDVFVGDEGVVDQLPVMDHDQYAKEAPLEREEDITVPAYRNPSHSVSFARDHSFPPYAEMMFVSGQPSRSREDEPRFTATSRIISQPRRSKASKKTNRPEYDYDIDIPVRYDDDAEAADGRIDEDALTEEDQDEMPRANVKIERVPMSKRARKATGGVPAAKRQSATRRSSRSKRDTESDATTQQSSSESDSFGDNGAIVSDASVRSGYSDDVHQQSKLQRRKREPNSPYTRRKIRQSKIDDDVEDDFHDDVVLGKRREVSHSRPVVLIRPSTTRRSSSAVASKKPTRPSKSGISSNARHLQVNGSSRRKRLNERFSDEDTEGSDIVEVMKSSTLAEGQSADAVLWAMSREVREKSGDHARLRSESDDMPPRNKGKDRASSQPRYTHDNAGLEGEGGADSDDSLPPPLRTRSVQSSEMADLDPSVQIDAPEGSPPALQDAAVFQDDFHLHNNLQDSTDFFDSGERVTRAASIAGPTAMQDTNLHNAPAVNSIERPPGALAAISPTLHTMMPLKVLDAVQSASSSESRAQSQERIRSKRGPTPANGKHRRFEEDIDLDEEEEVIVKDSAIVRDPHGRMIRKEEMLELVAEHERNAKGKGRPRASSLENAEGSVVDETELATGAAQESLTNEDGSRLPDVAFVDPDMDHDMNLGSVLEDDAFDEDEIFNLSIAKFEVQIEEFMEDNEPQTSTGLIEVAEGIVEEIEESFWEDEVELFVAQQLLDRHNRRKSNTIGRNAQTPSRPEAGPADILNQTPGSSQLGSVELPIPGASAAQVSKVTAVEVSQPLSQSDGKAALQAQDESTQLNDMDGRRMASRSLSPSRREASSASPQTAMATAEMSPELAIPEMPTRTAPRRTPSKVSPTKGRKHGSPFEQLAEPLRENGILQRAIREGDEELLVDEEPVIRPSVSERSKILPASPSLQSSALLTRDSAEILPENVLWARDVSMKADGGVRHARSSTPDTQFLGLQSTVNHAKQQASVHGSQRKRKQDNVYVEIQSPIRSSPGPKKGPRSQSPLQPTDSRSPIAMAAAGSFSTTLKPTGSANISEAITSPEIQSPGNKQDENASQADMELDDVAPEHSSTYAGSSAHVEEINAMFDEGLAGIAEELTGADMTAPLLDAAVPQISAEPSSLQTDETSGATAAEDPASAAMENASAQFAQTSTLPTDGACRAEADISTSLVDEATVESIGVTTETLVEVTEVATVTKAAETQQDHASEPMVTATNSDSDSEGPSEQGVSAPVHNADTSDGTGLATTSEDQDTSSSSSDDSPSATSADSSDETSDDAEGEDHDEEADQPFKLADLLAWVDSLKDEERPHLIGPRGAQKLFEQMNLSTEGALPLLLAWKLDSQNKAECIKADFVSLMRENEIDSPLKLSAYLSTVQTNTFAISSHVRFSSASDDEAQSQPKRTWRIPGGYRSFYQFAFDYTTKSGTVNTLNTEEARNLWCIVLAPALTPGQDVVNFMDSEAWTDVITKDGWLAMLDACTSANLSKTLEEQEATGTVSPELVKTFSRWLGDSTGSHADGRADPTL